ncbi:MAG: MFS transporter [Firmicutes bacterium]|nr:MFS transporter [Bacillota bacterium]
MARSGSARFRLQLPPHVWRLLAVRGLRSFTQSYLNVIAPLYLASLGLNGASLGLLFTASLLVGAGLLVPVGIAADRYRRKPFLLAFTVLMVLWGCLYATTRFLPLLLVVSAVAGIGRGGGGMGAGQAGPFQPAEQALLADMVPPARRRDVFSINTFVATLMAAAGAAVSGAPVWLSRLGVHSGDSLLFWLTAALGAISLALLWGLPEPRRPRPKEPLRRGLFSAPTSRIVWRQALAGSINAFGMGFVNPLFVYWLYLRFHVGADVMGPVFAVSFLLNGGTIYFARELARRIGTVRTIVLTRVSAALITAGIAFCPTFAWAAVLQVVRTALTMMVVPVRQSFTMNLIPSEERASATGVTGLARRVVGSISPSLAGMFLDSGELALPFYCSGGLLTVSAWLYYRFFHRFDDRGSGVIRTAGEGPALPLSVQEPADATSRNLHRRPDA